MFLEEEEYYQTISIADSSSQTCRVHYNTYMYSSTSPYGNLYNTDTSSLQTVHFVQNSRNLYLYNMDHLPVTDSTLGPMEFNIHIISSTSIIQTPFYYRQYTLSKSVQNSYNLYLYNMGTSLLQTVLGPEDDQNSHNLYLCNTDTSLLQTVHLVQRSPKFT